MRRPSCFAAKRRSPGWGRAAWLLVFPLVASCVSPAAHRRDADRVAGEIIGAKQQEGQFALVDGASVFVDETSAGGAAGETTWND